MAFEHEFPLPRLITKKEVDTAIRCNEDKVVVLRFGRRDDPVCVQLDKIVGSRPVLFETQ
jgi:hypothetical protein